MFSAVVYAKFFLIVFFLRCQLTSGEGTMKISLSANWSAFTFVKMMLNARSSFYRKSRMELKWQRWHGNMVAVTCLCLTATLIPIFAILVWHVSLLANWEKTWSTAETVGNVICLQYFVTTNKQKFWSSSGAKAQVRGAFKVPIYN